MTPPGAGTSVSGTAQKRGYFRALRAHQKGNRPLPAPLETCGLTPAKTLPRNPIQSIQRVGIGEAKRKSQIKLLEVTYGSSAVRMLRRGAVRF
jgi:hypothetical protein